MPRHLLIGAGPLLCGTLHARRDFPLPEFVKGGLLSTLGLCEFEVEARAIYDHGPADDAQRCAVSAGIGIAQSESFRDPACSASPAPLALCFRDVRAVASAGEERWAVEVRGVAVASDGDFGGDVAFLVALDALQALGSHVVDAAGCRWRGRGAGGRDSRAREGL